MDGKASVLDGICPHLGANLGHTGVVSGNCLKCIFHGWEFDSTGTCVKVHGTDTIPHNAKVKKYPTMERNGMILVYYDAEDRDPAWEMEPHPNVEAGEWYISGETYNVVHAHINEIPENGADAAHLDVLHQPFIVDSLKKAMDHRWTCTWEVNKDKPHTSLIALTQGMNIFGAALPFSDVQANIRQIGPGIVILELDTVFGKLVTYETIIPTRCTSQIARHVTFAAPTVPRIVGKFIMWGLEEQFNRDVPIWETKKYIPKPLISKADGPILNYRRWMSQFYTPASVSFADALAKEYMLDW
jgi:cholesterol 7-desaturase